MFPAARLFESKLKPPCERQPEVERRNPSASSVHVAAPRSFLTERHRGGRAAWAQCGLLIATATSPAVAQRSFSLEPILSQFVYYTTE